MEILRDGPTSIASSQILHDGSTQLRDAPSVVRSSTQSTDTTVAISDSESFQAWRRQVRGIAPFGKLPTVMFQLPQCSHEQNRSMSALANRYQKACGCTSGKFLMSATFAGIVVFYFVSGGHLSSVRLAHIGLLAGLTVLAALFGKLLGLLWARWRLLKIAARIDAIVRTDL